MRIRFLSAFLMLSGLAPAQERILFIRGADRSGGFLEANSDASRTEQLADIDNFATNGGNHGWGELKVALQGEGFVVEQIEELVEPGAPATGQTQGLHLPLETLNLVQYDAIVFGSNNARYDTAAVDTLEAYVRAGGAALFISDANFGSDWCDASNSDQQFLTRFGLIMNQDQGTYTVDRAQSEFIVPGHPIFEGVDTFMGEGVTPGVIPAGPPPAGVTITRLAAASGNTRVNDGTPGSNRCQGSSRATTSSDGSLIVAAVDSGRVAIHFDRNTFFNLNGAGTDINEHDNKQYARNLFWWLATGGSAPPPSQDPFGNNGDRWPVPGRIELENYDTGGAGVAYEDSDGGNNGGDYRPAEGVDIRESNDGDSGFRVGWSAAGEWIEYSVEVAETGTYDLAIRVAANNTSGTVRILLDGVALTGNIALPVTGSWETWQTLNIPGLTLVSGPAILRVEFLSGGFDLNWIEFTRATVSFSEFIAGYPALGGDDALPEADPDRDGLPNFAEQKLALDPTIFDPWEPVAVREGELHYSFTCDSAAEAITLTLEKSSNLETWSPIVLLDGWVTERGDLREIEARFPLSGPRCFLRLKIIRAP